MSKIRVLDNVYDLITINMEDRFKDNVAFRFYDTANDAVTTILYKDYVQDIRKAVNYFQSTIPEIKGKKICLLTKNSYEYAVNTFGVVAAGAVLVLLNQRKSWDELSYELGLVEPDAILTDGDDYGFNDQLKAAYGEILRPMDGFRSYEPAQLTRCIDHEALMVLMFTSGTTGRSKGVMLSEKNFFSVMRAHTQIGEHMMAYKHEPNLVMSQYTVLPMFHLGAFICLFSWAHAGWALNVSSDIRNFYKEVKRMPSQAMAVVPVIMNSLHHDVMRGRKDRLGELWVPICSSAMFRPAGECWIWRNTACFGGCRPTAAPRPGGRRHHQLRTGQQSTSALWVRATIIWTTRSPRTASCACTATASCWATTRTRRPPPRSLTRTAGSTLAIWPARTRTATIS